MRKVSVVIIAFSLLAAAVGFMVRDIVLKTAFEPISGLAIPGSGTAALLTALTVAVAAVAAAAVCIAGALSSGGHEKPSAPDWSAKGGDGGDGGDGAAYDAKAPGAAAPVEGGAADGLGLWMSGTDAPETAPAYAPDAAPFTIDLFTLSVLIAGGVMWLAGSVAGLFAAYGTAASRSYSDMIFALLSALSALSVMRLARGAYVGRVGGVDRFLSVIPPLFFSYWLIRLYMANASNPVILIYGYECLAVAAAAMCFYFLSGCVYGKFEPGKTVFCLIMTVFLCGTVSADAFTLPERLALGASLLIALANISPFIRRLTKKDRKKERTA
jgi:hypothetical protein